MKFFLVCFVCVMMLGGGAEAEVFSPTSIKLEGYGQSAYNRNNGYGIHINISGSPASAMFCILTSGEPDHNAKIKSGYLGWHYVNKIDTCIYQSSYFDLEVGRNTIYWDGYDLNGNFLYCQDFRICVWGIDRNAPIQKAITNNEFSDPFDNNTSIIALDDDGLPLANPILYKAQKRAYIGSDFGDSTLVELSTIQLDEGWEWQGTPQIDSNNHKYFNISVINKSQNLASIQKLKWIPNGVAEIQRRWGEEDGYSYIFETSENVYQDLAANYRGGFLYQTSYSMFPSEKSEAKFSIYFDDGSLVDIVDLSSWWISQEDYASGGQLNGGPTNIATGVNNGSQYVFMNSHASCLNQMVDPLGYLETENPDDFLVWSNGNGDYFLDKNFEETAERRWVCNDYTVGPYANSIAADNTSFSVVGLTEAGARSFALLAPDGTGLGYETLHNGAHDTEYSNFLIVDSNTPYDGMYFEASANGSKSYYYQACFSYTWSSFTVYCSVDDETTPAPFTLSQNSPNPFNPVTSIPFDLAIESKVTLTIYNVAGETIATLADGTLGAGSHNYDWDASNVASGVYFYKLDVGEYSETMKMTVVK